MREVSLEHDVVHPHRFDHPGQVGMLEPEARETCRRKYSEGFMVSQSVVGAASVSS